MTTLASAVAIGDNQLIIDAPMAVGQVPGWVKIDDELLKIGGQHFRTGTTLVLSDPATAVHSSGATVTYAGRPYDADFLAATGGTGGEQTIRLLGPFTIGFDAPGITNEEDGALVTTLEAGVLVLQIGVIVNTAFNGSDGHGTFFLGGSDYAAPDDDYHAITPQIQLATTNSGVGHKVGANSAFATTPTVALWSVSFGILTTSGAIVALLDDADATAGSMDIYVLIAEPA